MCTPRWPPPQQTDIKSISGTDARRCAVAVPLQATHVWIAATNVSRTRRHAAQSRNVASALVLFSTACTTAVSPTPVPAVRTGGNAPHHHGRVTPRHENTHRRGLPAAQSVMWMAHGTLRVRCAYIFIRFQSHTSFVHRRQHIGGGAVVSHGRLVCRFCTHVLQVTAHDVHHSACNPKHEFTPRVHNCNPARTAIPSACVLSSARSECFLTPACTTTSPGAIISPVPHNVNQYTL